MTDKFNFAKLLGDYNQIIIPIIQRDYAQGREEKKAKESLDSFLKELKNFFDKEGEGEYNFNFIYGVEGEEQSKNLYIIDGQQRLTLLFLLHLFLLKNNKVSQDELKKFTYQTRDTSKRFIESLVDEFNVLLGKVKDKTKEAIKDTIKNQGWYQYEFNFDPTIKSMIEVISRIITELELSKITKEKLNNITFQFLSVNKVNHEDLYIKMNARGRSLTDFENFKNQLFKKIDSLSNKEKFELFKKKLDNEYLNYFFNLTNTDENNKNKNNNDNKNECKFDEYMMQYCHSIIINYSIFNDIGKDNNNKKFSKTDGFRFAEYFTEYDFNKYFNEEIQKDKDIIETLYKTLDIFCNPYISKNIEYFDFEKFDFKRSWKNDVDKNNEDNNKEQKLKPTYAKQLMIFAITEYIRKYYKEQNEKFSIKNVDEFNKYLRIARNLIMNSDINTKDAFVGRLQFIRQYVKLYNVNLYNTNLEELSRNITNGFEEYLIKEEDLKLKLIQNNPEIYDDIKDVENNINNNNNDDDKNIIKYVENNIPYQNGQIMFLLTLAGINNNKLEIEDVEEFKKIFTEMANKFTDFINGDENEQAKCMLRYYMCHRDSTNNKFYFRYSGNETDKLSWRKFLNNLSPEKLKLFYEIIKLKQNPEKLKLFYEIIKLKQNKEKWEDLLEELEKLADNRGYTNNNFKNINTHHTNILKKLIDSEDLLSNYTNNESHISIYDKCNYYITKNYDDRYTIENLKYLLILNECLKKITENTLYLNECLEKIREKTLHNKRSTHGKNRADNLCLYIKTDETEYCITEFTDDGDNRGCFEFKSKGKNDTEWKIEEKCLTFEEVIDKTRNIDNIEEAGIKEKEKEK